MADTTPTSDLVHVDDVIAKLSAAGMSVEAISSIVDTSIVKVKGVLTRRRDVLSPEDAKLAEDVRKLTSAAIRHAFLILDYGPSEQRLAIVKSMLGNAAKALGGNEDTTVEETRVEFEQMLAEMRDVPARQTIVTEEEIIDVESTPAVRASVDQDEKASSSEAGPFFG